MKASVNNVAMEKRLATVAGSHRRAERNRVPAQQGLCPCFLLAIGWMHYGKHNDDVRNSLIISILNGLTIHY